MININIFDKDNNLKTNSSGDIQTALVYKNKYELGDYIVISVDEPNKFYWVQVDDALGKSLVYLTGDMKYEIPFYEKKLNLSPKTFNGERHLLSVRKAYDFEYKAYRNLALNVNDQHGQNTSFPHAVANVETRGESVFAAKNAIDGVINPESHGKWPYQSWGINMREDAQWQINFGRTVCIDRIIIYLRADFPHDNWWKELKITFSDGSEKVIALEKGGHAQEFIFDTKQIEWLKLSDLKKADDPSPFPALTQIEIYGTEKL